MHNHQPRREGAWTLVSLGGLIPRGFYRQGEAKTPLHSMGGRAIFKKSIGSLFIKKGELGVMKLSMKEPLPTMKLKVFFKYLVQYMLISI